MLRWRDDAVAQHHRRPLEGALDHVAGIQEQRGGVVLAHGHAARRTRREEIAWPQRQKTREVLDDARQLPDLLRRVHAHALLAVDAARDPDVVGVRHFVHRDDAGTERTETGRILRGPETRAGGDLALLRVTAGEIVEQRDARHVIARVASRRGLERAASHDEGELGLVIEMDHAARPHDVGIVTGQAGVQLHESGGLARNLLDQVRTLQLLEMRTVVLPHAQELVGVGNRRHPANRIEGMQRGAEALRFAQGAVEQPPHGIHRRRAALQQFAQRPEGVRRVIAHGTQAVADVEHAILRDHADPCRAAVL